MNSVCIVGRMCADPETRETQAGGVVCRFCVAVDKRTKDGESAADFLDCVAFGKTAEFVAKWFRKGKRVGVEGSIHSRTWEGDDGKKRKAVEITARQISFVDSKASSESSAERLPQAEERRGAFDSFEAVEDDVPF